MLGVRRVDVVARGEVQDRRAADVVEQRRLAVEVRAEEDALAQARLGDLDRVEAARLEHGLHDDRAGEDEVGARVLDALDRRALGCGQRGELVDERVEALAADLEALHADRRQALLGLHRRGEVAHRAADADEPLRRCASSHGASRSSVSRTCFCSALRCFLGASLGIGQEVLGHAHGAQRPRAEPARVAAVDLDELQRAAAEVEHDAVGERRRVHGRDVAVVRLLLLGEHAHLEAGLALDAREELRLVGGVADRARRDRLDVLRADLRRLAEVREDLRGFERAPHRLLAELAGRLDPLADANGEVDLVGALPPARRPP